MIAYVKKANALTALDINNSDKDDFIFLGVSMTWINILGFAVSVTGWVLLGIPPTLKNAVATMFVVIGMWVFYL